MDSLPGKISPESDALVGIERALKSHQLYEGLGPQYREHVRGLLEVIEASEQDTTINVSPFGPYLDGDDPPAAETPARLWFELFEEGVRQIVVRRRVTVEELDEFLRVLSTVDPSREDIVTRLWRRDLPHIHTHIVRRLVGVCRTPSQAQQDIRERNEYWRSGVIGSTNTDGGRVGAVQELDRGDLRVLATAQNSFDWCRLSRPRSNETRAGMRRPKMATEVDRYLADYDRFLDVADVLNDAGLSVRSSVLSAMMRHGNADSTRQFCAVLLERSDGLPDDVVAMARQAMDGLVADTAQSSVTDVFEHAPRPTPTPQAAETMTGSPPPRDSGSGSASDGVTRAQIEVSVAAMNDPNPRVACDAINHLFDAATFESVSAALAGHSAPSSSVRNLVLVRALKLAAEDPIDAIQRSIDAVLVQAFSKDDPTIRMRILREFEERPTPRRGDQVRRWVSNPSFKFRGIEERCDIIRVLGAYSDAKTIAFLGDLLTQVRLFSSETEMQFQIEVAKVLLRINTHQSRLHVYRVMKGWTVPKTVKVAVQKAIEAAKHAEGETS